MSGVEIERKWLVAKAPTAALTAPSELIEQGYLTVGPGGGETRLRRHGSRCLLTVKAGQGMERLEHEIEVTAEQFDALWPATEGARLVKRRHVVHSDGVVIELDVYEGVLSGLLVAEVEFDDPWGATSFVPPYWFGPEVTDDPAYRNQRLALADDLPPAPTSR